MRVQIVDIRFKLVGFFLVIILAVMGFFGGEMSVSITILLFFSFILLPAIYAMFYLLIKSTSIEQITRIEPEQLSFKQFVNYHKNSFIIFGFGTKINKINPIKSNGIEIALLYITISF